MSNIFYWRYRGFWLDMFYLGRDGVYFVNFLLRSLKFGDFFLLMKKYLRSIKNVVFGDYVIVVGDGCLKILFGVWLIYSLKRILFCKS